MLKLVILDTLSGHVAELDIHPAILQALANEETTLTTVWHGWAMQGFLCTSDEPGQVRTRKFPNQPVSSIADAGTLNLTLTQRVDCPHDPGFLPYDKAAALAIIDGRNR